MSEFCAVCAKEHGFANDFTIEKLELADGYFTTALCEGCGTVFIVNNGGEEFLFRCDKILL